MAQYTVGDKRRYIYGKTSKDVAARLNKAIAERDSGIVYDSESLKVADYLDTWLDSIRDTLREMTWRRHEEISRLHLKPTLGSVRQDKMNAFGVQSLYRSKLDSIALVSEVGPLLVYLGSVIMRRGPRHPRYCTRQPISPRSNTTA